MPLKERRILDKDKEIRKLKKTAGHYFTCTIDSAIKNEKLKQELVRTKKALDIAEEALKWIDETYELGMGYEAEIRGKCELALEEINKTKVIK